LNPNQPNPYAPPSTVTETVSPGHFDPVSLKKIEAIVKDAGQFWIAILMCIFCTGLGSIIIGPWYLVRLLQWNSLAKADPRLLDPAVPRGSIAQRFQSAKGKLIAGMSFGVFIFVLSVLFLVFTIVNTPRRM